MAYPVLYDVTYSYTGFQQSQGNNSFPGTQLDADLAGLEDSIANVSAFMQKAFRSDGSLSQGAVTYDSLSPALQLAGLQPAVPWATPWNYVVGNNVTINNNLYRCLVDHTSGVFATDLAAGKWLFITSVVTGPQGPQGPQGVPGTVAVANATGTIGLTAVNGTAATAMRSDGAPALSQAIAPTWTALHIFGAGTYSALFLSPAGFGGQLAPSAPVHVGSAAALSSGPNILSARANTGNANVHGIVENSTYNLSAAGLGVADFDALATYSGAQTYDHHISFQSRPTYGSSSLITNLYGFGDFTTVNGPATNWYAGYASNPIGTGTIVNAYGFFCEAITKGGTLNYAFYSAGTTPSKFGGNIDVGGLSLAGVDQLGAWATYTPTLSVASGALGTGNTTSGRYKQIGKTVFFSAQVTMGASGQGTGAGYLIVGLPVAAKQVTGPAYVFSGMMSGLIGLSAIIDTTTTIDVVKAADGTYPGANSRSFYITGSYEAA